MTSPKAEKPESKIPEDIANICKSVLKKEDDIIE